MRKNATFIYLACLSLVDLCALLTGLGDIVLISFFRLIVREQSVYICRISTFLLYSSTHLSSFLLASVSIDRAIATNFIQLAKKFSKPQTAYTIILVSTLVAVFLNFHFLLFLGYRIDNYQVSNFSSGIKKRCVKLKHCKNDNFSKSIIFCEI